MLFSTTVNSGVHLGSYMFYKLYYKSSARHHDGLLIIPHEGSQGIVTSGDYFIKAKKKKILKNLVWWCFLL